MGRGSSKAGGGNERSVSTLSLSDGSSIDLQDSPLVYGGNDSAVTGKARSVIEEWESKRVKNKIEYCISTDQEENPIGPEVKGGRGSVRIPRNYLQDGAIHTHIHPRREGQLGGTFSDQDLRNFANRGVTTLRAKAKEGAYSISKGKNFDNNGFMSYVSSLYSKEGAMTKSTMSALEKRIKTDSRYEYKQYSADYDRAFNTYLVALHNGLREGQKKYGYTYTLEGGK